jgi:hypothetical protein
MFEIYVRLTLLVKVYEARAKLQPLLHFDSVVNDVEDSNKKVSEKMYLSSIGLREREVCGWEEKMNVFVCIIV